jgi:hypothetical protein
MMATDKEAAGAAHVPVRQLVAEKSRILMPMTVVFMASYIGVSASANFLFLLPFWKIQFRRGDRWHDVEVRIVGGTGDDRTGNARRRSVVAAGQFDRGLATAGFPEPSSGR